MKNLSLIFALVFLTALTGCMEGFSGRKGRPLIDDLANKEPDTYCTGEDSDSPDCILNYCQGSSSDPVDCVLNYCLGDGTDNASCVDNYCTGSQTPDNDGCIKKYIQRPRDSIFINRGYCACKDGEPDIHNNCTSYCATTAAKTATSALYLDFSVGADVELNETLGNTKNWCSKTLNNEDSAPGCILMFKSEQNSEISVNLTWLSNNSAKVSLLDNQILYNHTYLAYLKETSSGLISDVIQIRRVKYNDGSSIDNYGTLKIMPISQYTCINRNGQTGFDGNYYYNALKTHYYFPSNESPITLPPGSAYFFCHDINLQQDDSPTTPRLEIIPQAISLWDKGDKRFYKSIDQTNLDINLLIKDKLESDYNLSFTDSQNINIFAELPWATGPQLVGSNTTNPDTPLIGFYMTPWKIDSNNGQKDLALCPTQEDYNGSNPYFKVLKEIVGVDTEGVYVGEREPMPQYDSQGNIQYIDGTNEVLKAPNDFLLITETELKKIWFYYKDGQYITPDEKTASQNTVMFYWPPDPDYPKIKKSYQNTYTIKSSEQLSNDNSRNFPAPSDKRYGCIPKMTITR